MLTSFRRGFTTALGVVVLSASLASCGVHWDYGHPILPDFSAQQALEQRLVRTERLLTQVLPQVTDCSTCAPFIQQFLVGSVQRQTALGGVWEPWDNPVPAGAEQPDFHLPEFSPQVSELPIQLLSSALSDLTLVPAEASVEERQLVASIVVPRLLLGVRLAQETGTWPAVLQSLPVTDSFSSNADFLPEGGDSISTAVRDWDCAVQTLPGVTAKISADKHILFASEVRQLVLALEDLSLTAFVQKASDKRLGSCLGAVEASLENASAESMFSRIYQQLLISTAIATSEFPNSGKSSFAELPEVSFTLGALFTLLEATGER